MDEKVCDLEVLCGKNLTIHRGNVNPKKDFAKYWTKEEIDAKLSLVNNYQHKMFIMFLWMSGVRVSESITLKKQNIDFANQVMTVKWLKSRKWNERVVPVHPLLLQILEVYTAPLKDSEIIFSFSRQRAWQICKKHLNGHPHQLRHSFAVKKMNLEKWKVIGAFLLKAYFYGFLFGFSLIIFCCIVYALKMAIFY